MSTQYTASWCFFHALCKYCARRGTLKSIFSGSLCSLSLRSISRKNTVCLLLEFWPPGINPLLMIEWRLTHIQYGKCIGRICSESQHCPAMKDQWDYVLSVLEELGGKQLFLKYQSSTDISFLLLLLLPSMLSIDCQTNEEFVGIDSEDVLYFPRHEPLHPLLVALAVSDEEDGLLSAKLRTQKESDSLVQYQSCSSFQMGTIFGE